MIRPDLTKTALAAFAAATFAGGAAYAQTPDTAVNPPPTTTEQAPTGTPANAVSTEQMTPDGRRIMLLSSPTPANQAYALKAGDPSVVSNPPVPDTPENRAKYGGPTSNGGKKTAPRGN